MSISKVKLIHKNMWWYRNIASTKKNIIVMYFHSYPIVLDLTISRILEPEPYSSKTGRIFVNSYVVNTSVFLWICILFKVIFGFFFTVFLRFDYITFEKFQNILIQKCPMHLFIILQFIQILYMKYINGFNINI